MTFKNWIFSDYNNPEIKGQWGLLHIGVLTLCIITIIALALIFRKRSEKARNIVLYTLVSLIFVFEISRRIINLIKMTDYNIDNMLYTLLPRPWCAISCWLLIFAVIFRKKALYNFGCISAFLCAVTFYVYPEAGFNNQYILFENLYSIGTHSLLLITSITLITLKKTYFDYKTIWQELIIFATVIAYAFLEIYVLGTATDPLYFMPNNDIQNLFGLPYWLFLVVYLITITVVFNLFYLFQNRKTIFAKKRK